MKLAGFLLLPSGWFLVIATAVLLRPGGAQGAFILAGIAVEVLGLVLAFRAHRVPRRRNP